ncbi:hypothetical protein BDB00DRAFT_756751, partial [Zychaea mexicana]|uniref:uncharacterized protein n=1 Tax=Zychaea mexicana TaxID=64656 RepID=UPI0022FE63E4
LVVEVKSQLKTNEQDFFKVAVEIKIMLDSMVERHVPDLVVFGVLVEGFTMRTFKMDLEYDRIYRFINMRACYLPRGRNDMGVLEGTLRGLFQLKVSAFFVQSLSGSITYF